MTMNSTELPLAAELIEQLKNTPQNPRYHAEGSVLEHTRLVLEKYFEMRDEFDLTEEEKAILYWVSVLHDTGKTIVTKNMNGRWVSHGHETASVPIARDHLLKVPEITDSMLRKILPLIRWHGIPLRWVLKKGSLDELKQMGTQVDLRLLSIFSVFDFYGRISEDQDYMTGKMRELQSVHVPKVEYEFGKFNQLQTLYGDWDLKRKNAAWNAIKMKRMPLLQKLFESEGEPKRAAKHKVMLTIGPPKSGKTRFLDTELQDTYRIQLSDFGLTEIQLKDDFEMKRKLTEFKHLLQIYLRHHGEVAIEGRNINKKLRWGLNEVFRNLSAEIHYFFFESSKGDLISRNQQAETPVAEEVIEKQYTEQEIPHPWEAHQITFVRG